MADIDKAITFEDQVELEVRDRSKEMEVEVDIEEENPDFEGFEEMDDGSKENEDEDGKLKSKEEGKEAKPAEEKPEGEEEPSDPFLKIETELAKDEKDADLTEFSDREKAYYHQMRRDRKSRQTAEKKLAEAEAKLADASTKKETEKAETQKAEAESALEALKKKDPTDFLTVEEVLALFEKQPAATPQPTKEGAKPADGQKPEADQPQEVDPVHLNYLKMCDNEARAAHPDDYDAVMELTDEIINKNPEHLKAVGEAMLQGGNPAEKSYELIKNDPEFSALFPAAKTRWQAKQAAKKTTEQKEETPKEEKPKEELTQKEKDAQAAEEALEKNKKRTKTTGHVDTSGGDKPADELTLEQVAAMPQSEFNKLPKKTQEKCMKMYG